MDMERAKKTTPERAKRYGEALSRSQPAATMRDMADEIERLRSAISHAAERLDASLFTNSEHSQAKRILNEALAKTEVT